MFARGPKAHRRRGLGLVAALGLAACGPGRAPAPAAVAPAPASAAPAATPASDAVRSSDDAEAPTTDELRIAAIERAVNETRDTRHACWALGAADNYHLEGRMVLRLTFGAGAAPKQMDGQTGGQTDGQVGVQVDIIEDEPRDARLTTCMVQLYQAYRWPSVFAPGTAIELPFSFQAPRWQHTVQAAHVAPHTAAGGKLTARVLLHEQNTGNGAAGLTLLTLQDGLDVPLHRHTSAEILYVLEGEGLVYGLDGPGRGTPVHAGQGIYVPAGTAHGFVHRGRAPARLVQLYAPSGPERRFLGGPPVGTTPVPGGDDERRGPAQPGPLVRATPAVFDLAGGEASVAIYFDQAVTGDAAAYLGVLTARPGMQIPSHVHAGETEIILVLAGAGTMTVAGDTVSIEPMTAVQVPPGVAHAFSVTGTEPVVAVQFYTPSGPEQRFKGQTP